ncbi:MAG: acyl-CoA dehydrogenase family protein [Alphaproteobacteria bacterium]
MDFSLSDDQRAFRDAARGFAVNEMAPHASTWDEEKIFPEYALHQAGGTAVNVS